MFFEEDKSSESSFFFLGGGGERATLTRCFLAWEMSVARSGWKEKGIKEKKTSKRESSAVGKPFL